MSLSVELYFLQQAKFLGLLSPGGHSPEVDGQLTGQSTMAFLRAAAEALRSASSAPQRRSPR